MPIAEVVRGIFEGAVKPVLDKILPDAQQRVEAELLFYKQAHEINLGQLDITKQEVQSQDKFVSRGRPSVVWVCSASFAYAMIGRDMLNWIIALIAVITDNHLPELPPIDNTVMFDTLMALLGLGAYRTYEKTKGIASK